MTKWSLSGSKPSSFSSVLTSDLPRLTGNPTRLSSNGCSFSSGIFHWPRNCALEYPLPLARTTNLLSPCRIIQILSHELFKTLPVARQSCMGIYVWRLVACQAVLTAVELVLIHRGECSTFFVKCNYVNLTLGCS